MPTTTLYQYNFPHSFQNIKLGTIALLINFILYQLFVFFISSWAFFYQGASLFECCFILSEVSRRSYVSHDFLLYQLQLNAAAINRLELQI